MKEQKEKSAEAEEPKTEDNKIEIEFADSKKGTEEENINEEKNRKENLSLKQKNCRRKLKSLTTDF